MLEHTMIVAFEEPLPDAELDQYLADIEKVMLDSGTVRSFVARRHIAVPGEEDIPALVATAIVRFTVADREALARAFTVPGLHELIGRWQARHPYRVGYANHEPLTFSDFTATSG
ncbi:hypothetical protein [Actinoplanes sp. NPDC049265]|uniref:hypothetical protein n=1 Tax=Actinoplanes sp. NPDC049265 TaxID=3363902 RepID=UPI003712F8B8